MSIFNKYLNDNRHFLKEVKAEHVHLCEQIAEEAHATHTRWNGDSYKASHLTRIANRIEELFNKNILQYDTPWKGYEMDTPFYRTVGCVAWLHDVLEDCRDEGYDSHILLERGVPLCVVQEVRNLTRLPGESYLPYIIRLCNSNSPISMLVKLLDIEDNLSDLDSYQGTERHRDCYELSRYIIEQRWFECAGMDVSEIVG